MSPATTNANDDLSHLPGLPAFPSDLPTAPLLRLSLQKLLDNDVGESQRLYDACKEVGFFYLDLRDAKGVIEISEDAVAIDPKGGGSQASFESNRNANGHASTSSATRDVDGNEFLSDAQGLFGIAKEFFDLPVEEKVKYDFASQGSYFGYKGYGAGVVDKTGKKDRGEFYNISRDDILNLHANAQLPHPTLISPQKPLLTRFLHTSHALTALFLTHLTTHLHLPPKTLTNLHHLHAPAGDQIRFTRAPPQPAVDRSASVGAHTDFGSVTLLFNQLGGLKILPPSSDGQPEDRENEEKWLWVKPLRGHCVVNLGDAMVKFTRGVLRSNVHKVVNPPGEQANLMRYSIVHFARPEDEVMLKPLEGSDIIDARKELVPDEQELMNSKDWVLRRAFGRRGVGDWDKSEGTEGMMGMRQVKVA